LPLSLFGESFHATISALANDAREIEDIDLQV
jgi:hypothetical protein